MEQRSKGAGGAVDVGDALTGDEFSQVLRVWVRSKLQELMMRLRSLALKSRARRYQCMRWPKLRWLICAPLGWPVLPEV